MRRQAVSQVYGQEVEYALSRAPVWRIVRISRQGKRRDLAYLVLTCWAATRCSVVTEALPGDDGREQEAKISWSCSTRQIAHDSARLQVLGKLRLIILISRIHPSCLLFPSARLPNLVTELLKLESCAAVLVQLSYCCAARFLSLYPGTEVLARLQSSTQSKTLHVNLLSLRLRDCAAVSSSAPSRLS